MKLKFALFLSVFAISAGICVSNANAAKISSGESRITTEKLTQQLTLQKQKVKTLEAENTKLRDTVDALKSLAYAPNARKAQFSHTIKEGETVTQIANRNGISRENLMKVNHISENQQIYIGDVLIIPPAPPSENGEILMVKAEAPKSTSTPAPQTKTKTKTTPKPTPAKAPKIAWTPAKPIKTEKAAPKAPSTPPAPLVIKSVIAKSPPKKVEAPTTKPLTVAKVEAKPQAKVKAAAPKLGKTPKVKEAPKQKDPVMLAKTEPKPKPEANKALPPKKEKTKAESPKVELAKTETVKTQKSPEKEDYTFYTIKFGDNLGKIAKKYGISVGALMNFNNIKNPNKISGGQKLKIPSKETAKSLSKVKLAPVPALATSGDKPQPGDAYGVYIVQSGDNLYDLARDFFTTEKEIQSLNKMGTSNKIAPGQELIVPTAEYVKKSDLANN